MTAEQDPFDLPGWLGESEVTWCPGAAGSRVDTAVAIEAVSRLSRAVGATRPRSVLLRVGR